MSNEPGCSSSTSSKRKLDETDDEDIRKEYLKAARLVNHQFANDEEEKEIVTSESLANAIAVVKSGPRRNVISNEELEKLYRALCKDDGKEYDSDDSINSESDNIPAEVRERESEAMRATFHNMKEKMDQELKAIDELYAEYTPERRVNISRQLREQKMGDATKQEKELAEQKYQDEWARQVKKAKYQHQVFLEQEEPTMKYMTCSVFAELLQALADVMPENIDVPREYKDPVVNNHGKALEYVDIDKFIARIKFYSIQTDFFKGELTTDQFILLVVRKILLERKVRAVVNHTYYGFDFTTKECVQVLANLYGLQKNKIKDDGSSIDPLALKIGDLIWFSWKHARDSDPAFEPNQKLKDFYKQRFDA